MSSFLVRRVSQHNLHPPPAKQKYQNRLTIQPAAVTFDYLQHMSQSMAKVSISKLSLTNLCNTKIEYQIKQPNQQYFKVKYSKNQLNAGEGIQLYVFFNMDMCVSSLIDEFVIVPAAGKAANISVPINIKIGDQNRSRKVSRNRVLKKQGRTKQNNGILRVKHNRIGDDKQSQLKINVNRFRQLKIQQPLLSRVEQIQDYSLSARIRLFQKQYDRVVAFLKDKAIKNQIYKGKKQISRQRYRQIIEYNQKIEYITNQMNKQMILTRYKNNNNQNGPSVRTFENIKMLWSRCRNLPRITFKKGIQKLYRQVRNIVIFHRFRKMNKVLSIYRNLREQENIEQPQTKIINNRVQISVQQISLEESQIWEQDSQDREYQMQIQEKKKHDYYCRKISKMITNKKQRNLGADFTQFTLSPRLLPIDYEEPQAKKHHTFEIKPRIGFDNWVALEESTMYNHQLMKYHKTDRIPQWQCHPYSEDSVKTKSKTIKIVQRSDTSKQDTINIRHGQKKCTQKLLNQLKIQQSSSTSSQIACLPLSLSHRQTMKQFKQCCLQNTCASFKTYLRTQYWLQLLDKQQQVNAQLDVLKPSRHSIRDLGQIKYCRQEYLPYFVSPMPSLVGKFLHNMDESNDDLIYEIKKQHIIDFDQPTDLITHKIDYLQSMESRNSSKSFYSKHSVNANSNIGHHHSSNSNRNRSKIHFTVSINQCNHNKGAEQNNMSKDRQDVRDWKNQNEEGQQYMHEKIIDNLKKTQMRKYTIAQSKIASLNQFTKRNENKIYY